MRRMSSDRSFLGMGKVVKADGQVAMCLWNFEMESENTISWCEPQNPRRSIKNPDSSGCKLDVLG